MAAELELLPADRRIGCSVHRGASSLSLTSEKLLRAAGVTTMSWSSSRSLIRCVVKKPRLLPAFGRLCRTRPRDAEPRDVYYGRKSPPLFSEALFSFLTLLCLSHTSAYRQNTLQSRRDMTADECEHPQPHKWK